MSRTLSTAAVVAILEQSSGVAWHQLITIDHASLTTPIRLTDDQADIVSNGDTFTACGYTIELPDAIPDNLSRVSITIDNASQLLTANIRNINSPPAARPSLLLEIINSGNLNAVEASFNFDILVISIDDFKISGTIGHEEDLRTAGYPGITMGPNNFQGLFGQTI